MGDETKSQTVVVPQGVSVTYDGIRYHQGQTFQAPADYRLPEMPAAPAEIPPATEPPAPPEEG